MKRVACVISGRVQGVGYRNWVYSRAKLFKVFGFVRNLSDSSVEVLAEADEEILKEFIAEMKIGPNLSKVSQIECTWSEVGADPFTEFEVRKG